MRFSCVSDLRLDSDSGGFVGGGFDASATAKIAAVAQQTFEALEQLQLTATPLQSVSTAASPLAQGATARQAVLPTFMDIEGDAQGCEGGGIVVSSLAKTQFWM
eukprot:SAG11_NODE_34_length_22265_cov_11.264730_12_plen_104_part_00